MIFPFLSFFIWRACKGGLCFLSIIYAGFFPSPLLSPTFAKSAHIDFLFHPVLHWPLLHLKQRLKYWISVGSSFFYLSHTNLHFSLSVHSLFSPFFLVYFSLSEQLFLFRSDPCLCFPVCTHLSACSFCLAVKIPTFLSTEVTCSLCDSVVSLPLLFGSLNCWQ